MDIPSATRDRIFAAADAIYAESSQQTFPTVDAVRKLAKVNMNDASTGMKEWRRAQTAQIEPVKIDVPAPLQLLGSNGLQQLWSEAVKLANDTLRAAQSAWDTERHEADALREQIATAYEVQASILETNQAEVQAIRIELEEAHARLVNARRQADETMHENVTVCAAAEQAKARATEIEKRADDLRRELERAYNALVAANNDLAESRSVHAHEMADARQAWERERISMAQQATTLHGELSKAREEAAELRGALAAMGQLGQETRVADRGARQRDGGTARCPLY